MIRTRLTLFPKPGRIDAVLELYLRREVVRRSLAVPGCLEVEIAIPEPAPERVVVSALWRDRSAYETWLGDPGRAEDVEALLPLLIERSTGIGEAETSRVAVRELADGPAAAAHL